MIRAAKPRICNTAYELPETPLVKYVYHLRSANGCIAGGTFADLFCVGQLIECIASSFVAVKVVQIAKVCSIV